MASIIEQIKNRRSVRSYTGEPLSEEHKQLILNYIASLQAPFGVPTRINLIHTNTDSGKVKLGTYGFVGGASDFLTLVYEESPLADEGSAYLFEQVVLFCTELGLGTCWLGGSFSRKNFGNQLTLQPNEKLRIVSPVGYPSDKKRLWETISGSDKNHASRKPFGTYFFDNDFSQSLSEEKAGDFRVPLEMVRIAPSANNSQPWRIVLQKDIVHFYCRPPAVGGFSAIDLGIAMCHFEQTCRELSISGEFEVLDSSIIPLAPKNCRYVISWKRKIEKQL